MNFEQLFNQKSEITENAHARVNIIGEHTDYTGGFVMPTLLSFSTSVEISVSKEKKYQVYSKNYKNKKVFNDFKKSINNDWIDYVKGCLFVYFDENKKIKNTPVNIFISSNIPMERGISSSSALCVAILKSCNSLFQSKYSDKHIAILAQRVERDYIGVSGGIMDQMVSSIGIHGKGFFLDCLSLKYELLNIPENWKFCLVDSEVQRNLRDSSYNERYNQLKKAEKEIGTDNLGRIKLKDLDKKKFSDSVIYKRAKHVITENDRVLRAKVCLLENNIKEFGKLMNESHKSYSNDFEASTKDVDLITKRSVESGALGSRLTGGGFGGFSVSLIDKKNYNIWFEKMKNYYNVDKFFKV
tara:strand:- start:323 stop:1390 length:1068 start_codon:yes stop_codon:yes gene_type:complete